MQVTITSDWTGAALGFRELSHEMADARKPLKKIMHKFMMETVKKRFMSGGMPRWKNREKSVGWPILRKSGRLMRSATMPLGGENTISYPDKTSVRVVSNVPYASSHDKDRGYTEPNAKIYGRPFFEVTQKDVNEMVAVVADWATVNAQKSFGNR